MLAHEKVVGAFHGLSNNFCFLKILFLLFSQVNA